MTVVIPTTTYSLTKTIGYFYSLIDEHGIIQFSQGVHKHYQYGYAIEDQARALIVACWLGDVQLVKHLVNLISAMIQPDGSVVMLWGERGVKKQRINRDGEACAETFWALAEYYSFYEDKNVIPFLHVLSDNLKKSPWLKAKGYALLGFSHLEWKQDITQLAEDLVTHFNQHRTQDWLWFEETLTYANALLPWSLLRANKTVAKPDYGVVGLEALGFLIKTLCHENVPLVVGNKDWWVKSKPMAIYDQQPIDVAYQTLACLEAYQTTLDSNYLHAAWQHYTWFWGNNLQKACMIRCDGGCHDGLNCDGRNQNAGAESTICFLLASLALKRHNRYLAINEVIV